jgi:hypothetical protein
MEENNPYLAPKRDNNRLFLILTVVFGLLSAFLGWKLSQKSTQIEEVTIIKEQVLSERDKLGIQLQAIEIQYEELMNQNEGLDSLLKSEKAVVVKLRKELASSKGSVKSYRSEVEQLKHKLSEYILTIEQLKAQNQELSTQNVLMRTRLDSSYTANLNLSSRNATLQQTVATGKRLTIYDIITDAVRTRNTGKEIPTTRATRADRLRTCFLLGSNEIAEPGKKKVYVRIADPDGRILIPGPGDEFSFMFMGNRLQYTLIEEIDYKNKAMDICLYWDKKEEFKKGKYFVDIYLDDYLVGSHSFDLE